jgi:hypothetical protein
MKQLLLNGTIQPAIRKYGILALLLMCVEWTHAQILSSSDPALEGQPVTFTVEIDAPTGITATPTGTVAFADNGQSIGTAPVQNGIALFTTQFAVTGDHVIVADYSGDANFQPVTSPPFTEHISADTTFTLSVTPSVVTQPPGTSSTVSIALFSNADSPGPVHFNCENLPPGATCSFQPGSVVPSSAGTGATATITSQGERRAASMRTRTPLLYAGFFIPLLFARRRGWHWLLPLCALALFSIAGCGGNVRALQGGTPAGSYTIHITATDGTNTQQTAVKLNVT